MNLITNIARWRRRSGPASQARRGIAAIEFALTLPVWITLILGTIDGTYCMLVNEKVDRIASTVSDIVTQNSDPISVATLNDTIGASSQLMKPYDFSSTGVVIITSIYKAVGKSAVIKWQYTGGGSLIRISKIGTTGGTPILPNGLTMADGDSVVVAEVYYTFTPMFISDTLFPGTDIYRVAMYKPRLGPLTTTPS